MHPISGGCVLHKIFSPRVLWALNNFSSPSSTYWRSIKYELVPQKRIKGKLKDESPRSLKQIWTSCSSMNVKTTSFPLNLQCWQCEHRIAICQLSICKCTPWKHSSDLICCFSYLQESSFLQDIPSAFSNCDISTEIALALNFSQKKLWFLIYFVVCASFD